ncbi:MAG: Rrf2 family transcriptional regulator [Lewinellaceae bacterium]|nr:Rrf2 family transcriptional regulator [Lewinellaceae bacterium]
MRVISKSGEYGLRALLFMIAHREEGAFVSIREMAEELNISFHF